jgi:hypothetical protein
MIASRHGDHAAPPLVLGERGELDEGAAILERIGNLQVLVFDIDLGAGSIGVRRIAPASCRRAVSISASFTVMGIRSVCAPA